MKFIGTIARSILGIDDTELPENQVRYLKDISKTEIITKVNEENLCFFIDSIKDKHGIEEISLFRKGIAIFSSEENHLENINSLYKLFEDSKNMMQKKILMLKDQLWITISEKESFVFIIKKHVKMSEIEINAVSGDILKNLDRIILEEKHLMDSAYIVNN